jgi:hypothetical protein
VRLQYHSREEWPPLAWRALCVPGAEDVAIFHGRHVEARGTWFCEAVWDGPFDGGDFHRTDVVFGSGGRLDEGSLTFVSSGTTVDRLQALALPEGVWVSNSLPCLLAATRATVDPAYRTYFQDFRTIRRGLRSYKRTLATSAGTVQLTYYDNLRWDGTRLATEPKPWPRRDFSAFRPYRAFLESSLRALAANATAAERRVRYPLVGTMSSGHDSSTAAAIAAGAGLLHEVIAFDRARTGEPDSGRLMATALGLEVIEVSRDAWRETAFAEIPFLAADAKGEDVYFRGAEDRLAGRLVLTGFGGDRIWDRDSRRVSDDLPRRDQSGLSLSEYRLRVGFIHCPVPYLGARQLAEIRALGRSAELARWTVRAESRRPICRRVLEESGVPRQAIAVYKRAASVLFFRRDSFLAGAALSDYTRWLEHELRAPTERGLLAPARALARITAPRLYELATRLPSWSRLLRPLAHRVATFGDREPRFRYLFPWALRRATDAYVKHHPPA